MSTWRNTRIGAGPTGTEDRLIVDLPTQRLSLWTEGKVTFRAPVSTAAKGPGERMGSGCTPRGLFRVRLRIGAGCPPGTVFVGRRPTGERYTAELAARFPQRDWILSRILWLTGLQSGWNRGGSVDTLRRFIYIHGCPDSEPLGEPRSHGCIRMSNREVIALFERVPTGMLVEIRDPRGAVDRVSAPGRLAPEFPSE